MPKMIVPTKVFVNAKKKEIYLSDFKEFPKERLINELIDRDYLWSQWQRVLNGESVYLTREGSATKEQSVMGIGVANNYMTRSPSGVVLAYHPRRDFGNPPKFIIPQPGNIDFGAGVIDSQNQYLFYVGLFEAIEEVFRQYGKYTDVPQLREKNVPSLFDIDEINEMSYKKITNNIKDLKRGGMDIDINETRTIDSYIVNPPNSWNIHVSDDLGDYLIKALIAPELEPLTPVPNINLVLGGLVNLIPKNERITQARVFDGEYMTRNGKVIYFGRKTDVINITSGRVYTFQRGKLVKTSTLNELISDVKNDKQIVMKKYGIKLESANAVATPKVKTYYANGVSREVFHDNKKGVFNSPLRVLAQD